MSLAEAEKHWKAAQKLTSASFLAFRLKSDWEQAGPLYEKAANAFRQAKAWDRAREAWEMAATCSQHQNSPWHAAKQLEKAAEAAKETQDLSLAVDYHKQASLAFREAGRAQYAAETLSKAARLVEEKNPESQQIALAEFQGVQAACELLAEAVEEVESDGKMSQSADIYRQAINAHIRAEKHSEAVGLLLRFASACDTLQATSSLCKAYLGAVVVWLFAQNAAQAWAVYQDALAVDAFSQSEEAFAAEALFDAYQIGTAEAVQKAIASRPIFRDLDNQIARLAKKLPQGSVEKMAASLGGDSAAYNAASKAPKISTEDLDEDNLT